MMNVRIFASRKAPGARYPSVTERRADPTACVSMLVVAGDNQRGYGSLIVAACSIAAVQALPQHGHDSFFVALPCTRF